MHAAREAEQEKMTPCWEGGIHNVGSQKNVERVFEILGT
jgi:hypothetical protein